MSYSNGANCRKFSLLVSLMLLCLISRSQLNFGEVDKLLADNQKILDNNFITLIYKDGKVIYQKALGDLTVKSKVPVESASKWLTAALVMTFVDEGKISLDDKISTYLPAFETYKKPDITIRQCLAQQTGIEDNTNSVSKLFEKRKYENLEQEVLSFAQRGVSAGPGTTFIYGNMGLDIAGRVLEVISKMKFDALVKQRLFIPLNMRNSTFTPEDHAINPSAGAISTVADYMNFLVMLLDKGKFMGKQILSEGAVAQMQTVQTNNIIKKYTPKGAEGYEYGLGSWIEEAEAGGRGTVISGLGLPDAWPYIDKCRNYACFFFTKGGNLEKQKTFYQEFKKAIAKQLPSVCK